MIELQTCFHCGGWVSTVMNPISRWMVFPCRCLEGLGHYEVDPKDELIAKLEQERDMWKASKEALELELERMKEKSQ